MSRKRSEAVNTGEYATEAENASAPYATWVPVGSVRRDARNARSRTQRNLDGLKASLKRFGQQRPILVDADGIVRAGNGTHEAIEALGWETVWVIRTSLRGAEAIAYAVTDNRLAELSKWEDTLLAEALDTVRNIEGFDLAAVGFDSGEIDALFEKMTQAIAGPEPAAPEVAVKTGQYGVIVICENEAHQAGVYERLVGDGFNCRVVCT